MSHIVLLQAPSPRGRMQTNCPAMAIGSFVSFSLETPFPQVVLSISLHFFRRPYFAYFLTWIPRQTLLLVSPGTMCVLEGSNHSPFDQRPWLASNLFTGEEKPCRQRTIGCSTLPRVSELICLGKGKSRLICTCCISSKTHGRCHFLSWWKPKMGSNEDRCFWLWHGDSKHSCGINPV